MLQNRALWIAICAASLFALQAVAQDSTTEQASAADEPPPTTLPFAPTVQSAPPTSPSYPTTTRVVEAPPVDPVCLEIGPIIRAGVVASRFATLSPSTLDGAPIGKHQTGDAFKALGADYCTIVIPAASDLTADSVYNQVTCQLDMANGEAEYLEDMRDRRTELAEQIAACPAMARWTATPPEEADLSAGDINEDFLFSHPDVPVELVLRTRQHARTGDWPLTYMRSLDLIFRTPNPDRPEPLEDEPAP
ncbi:hypothetical protein WNY37_06545 [Henriciella sp. AS95]|uniref:hypothetical protein n=1 Tax=Henriciella sp. AS95 TaxID=3135782 RepID=UPI00317C08C9